MALAIWSCIVLGGDRAAVTLHHLCGIKKMFIFAVRKTYYCN